MKRWCTCPFGLCSRLKREINVASLGFLDGTELNVSMDDYYRQEHNNVRILLAIEERQRHLAIATKCRRGLPAGVSGVW